MQTVVSRDLSHALHLRLRTKRLCLTQSHSLFSPASVQLNHRGAPVARETREEQVNGVTVWPPRPTPGIWAAGVDIFALRKPRDSAADHFINHREASVPGRHPSALCSLLKRTGRPTDFLVTLELERCAWERAETTLAFFHQSTHLCWTASYPRWLINSYLSTELSHLCGLVKTLLSRPRWKGAIQSRVSAGAKTH